MAAKTPPPGWDQEAWAKLSKAQRLHYKKLHTQNAMDESNGNSDDSGEDTRSGMSKMQRLHLERQKKKQAQGTAARERAAATTGQQAVATGMAKPHHNRMAARIQARQRGRLARAQVGEKQAAATKLQAVQRGRAERQALAAKHKQTHTRMSDSQVHGKDKAAPVGPDGKPLTGVKLKVWEKKQEKLQRQQQELEEVR